MNQNEIELRRLVRDRNRAAFGSLILLGLAAASLTAIFKIPGLIACASKIACPSSRGRDCIFDATGEVKYFPVYGFTGTYKVSGLLCEAYCMSADALQKALSDPPQKMQVSLPRSAVGCIFGIVGIGVVCLMLLCFSTVGLNYARYLSAEIKRKTPRPPVEEALLLGAPDQVIEMPTLGSRGPTADPCGAAIFE